MRLVLYLFTLAVWAGAGAPVRAVMESRVERSFEVGEAAVLTVDTPYGLVNVRTVPGARSIEVAVIRSAEAKSEAEWQRRLEGLELEVERRADGAVAVSARFRRSVRWAWEDDAAVNLAYEIVVPAKCDVRIRTRDGQIVLGSIAGQVELAGESGPIFVQGVEGALTVRSRAGAVAVAACTGELNIETTTANITVGRAGGRTRLASRGGYMEVQRAAGELSLSGDGSDAQVGFVSPIREPAELTLSGGSLVVELENNAACALELQASRFGRVSLRGELPLDVTAGGLGESRLAAAVNGGGPRLTARVSGGNVRVRAVEPMPVVALLAEP